MKKFLFEQDFDIDPSVYDNTQKTTGLSAAERAKLEAERKNKISADSTAKAKKEADQERQRNYNSAVKAGNTAKANAQYKEAIAHYETALKYAKPGTGEYNTVNKFIEECRSKLGIPKEDDETKYKPKKEKETKPKPDDTETDEEEYVHKPIPGKLVFRDDIDISSLHYQLLQDVRKAVQNAQIGNVLVYSARRATDTSSRHKTGNALDLSAFNNIGYRTNPKKFKQLGDILVKELQKLGYVRWEGANKKSYIWQSAGHYNHIHVSNIMPDVEFVSGDTKISSKELRINLIMRTLFRDMNRMLLDPDGPVAADLFRRYRWSWWRTSSGEFQSERLPIQFGNDEEGAAKAFKSDYYQVINVIKKKYEFNKYANKYDKANLTTLTTAVGKIAAAISDDREFKIKVPIYIYSTERDKWFKYDYRMYWSGDYF